MAGAGSSGAGFVTGLLLGALAGAALAMIASPEGGEERRESAGARAREGADLAREVAGDVGDTASDLLERGRAIVERARARVDGAIAEGREAAEQQRTELTSGT
jgi:gas vesicle protein